MKILLINSNRYHYPPVIPIALEYLAGELSKSNHSYKILDLCFSSDPKKDIEDAIEDYKPEIVGLTIRQIDTVLYQNNEFFLDEIKDDINTCRNKGLRVILGGVGFSIIPKEILDYTQAEYGISGPGELALVDILDKLENNRTIERIIDGNSYFKLDEYTFNRIEIPNYKQYIEKDGIVGFRTQIGCTDKCLFCTEGGKRMIYHTPKSVGIELAGLQNKGYDHFHLCDSEFNINLDHCINVCKAIVEYAGAIDWALYMKPERFSDELFKWIRKSGATLITLSLDTWNVSKKSLVRLAEFFMLAFKNGIKVAIDLSTGFPNEKIENLVTMVEFLNHQSVSTVGINSFYRIYPGTPLYGLVLNDNSLEQYLIDEKHDMDFLKPVFFNYFSEDQLRSAIGNKPKFRIEGFEKATNYQRV